MLCALRCWSPRCFWCCDRHGRDMFLAKEWFQNERVWNRQWLWFVCRSQGSLSVCSLKPRFDKLLRFVIPGDDQLLAQGFVYNRALATRFADGFSKDSLLCHEISKVPSVWLSPRKCPYVSLNIFLSCRVGQPRYPTGCHLMWAKQREPVPLPQLRPLRRLLHRRQ